MYLVNSNIASNSHRKYHLIMAKGFDGWITIAPVPTCTAKECKPLCVHHLAFFIHFLHLPMSHNWIENQVSRLHEFDIMLEFAGRDPTVYERPKYVRRSNDAEQYVMRVQMLAFRYPCDLCFGALCGLKPVRICQHCGRGYHLGCLLVIHRYLESKGNEKRCEHCHLIWKERTQDIDRTADFVRKASASKSRRRSKQQRFTMFIP